LRGWGGEGGGGVGGKGGGGGRGRNDPSLVCTYITIKEKKRTCSEIKIVQENFVFIKIILNFLIVIYF
jgi:hypothetical protein